MYIHTRIMNDEGNFPFPVTEEIPYPYATQKKGKLYQNHRLWDKKNPRPRAKKSNLINHPVFYIVQNGHHLNDRRSILSGIGNTSKSNFG